MASVLEETMRVVVVEAQKITTLHGGSAEDTETFEEEVRRAWRRLPLQDSQCRLDVILDNIGPSIRDELRCQPADVISDPEKTLRAIARVFGEKRSPLQLLTYLLSLKQLPTETVRAYSHRCQRSYMALVKRQDILEEEAYVKPHLLRDIFISGIMDSTARRFLRHTLSQSPDQTFLRLREVAMNWCDDDIHHEKSDCIAHPVVSEITSTLQALPDHLTTLVEQVTALTGQRRRNRRRRGRRKRKSSSASAEDNINNNSRRSEDRRVHSSCPVSSEGWAEQGQVKAKRSTLQRKGRLGQRRVRSECDSKVNQRVRERVDYKLDMRGNAQGVCTNVRLAPGDRVLLRNNPLVRCKIQDSYEEVPLKVVSIPDKCGGYFTLMSPDGQIVIKSGDEIRKFDNSSCTGNYPPPLMTPSQKPPPLLPTPPQTYQPPPTPPVQLPTHQPPPPLPTPTPQLTNQPSTLAVQQTIHKTPLPEPTQLQTHQPPPTLHGWLRQFIPGAPTCRRNESEVLDV